MDASPVRYRTGGYDTSWGPHPAFQADALDVVLVVVAIVSEMISTYHLERHFVRKYDASDCGAFNQRVTFLFSVGFSIGKMLPQAGLVYFCGSSPRCPHYDWADCTRHYGCRKVVHNAVLTLCCLPFDVWDLSLLAERIDDESARGASGTAALWCKMVNTLAGLVYVLVDAVKQDVWITGSCCAHEKHWIEHYGLSHPNKCSKIKTQTSEDTCTGPSKIWGKKCATCDGEIVMVVLASLAEVFLLFVEYCIHVRPGIRVWPVDPATVVTSAVDPATIETGVAVTDLVAESEV